MAEKIFTDEEVGKYMNEHFVCMQIDVEKVGWQKETAEKFSVTVLPTLIFFKGDASVVSRLAGARDNADFLNSAKVATGEQLSFEKLYDRAKSKKDLADMQLVLKQAPEYVGGFQGWKPKSGSFELKRCTTSTQKPRWGRSLLIKRISRL